MDMNAKMLEQAPTYRPSPATRHAVHIVNQVFRDYPGGIDVRLWDGHMVSLGVAPSRFTLVFNDPARFRELMLHRDPLRLAEAHCSGEVEIEGSIFDALRLKDHFQSLRLSTAEKASIFARSLGIRGGGEGKEASRAWYPGSGRRHARDRDLRSAALHYDLSDAFYALWLDSLMVYSCAYFETPEDSLDQAQRQKFEHVCRKLRLKPGERLLDIGCGWGGLMLWAARHYGAHVHGITLSRNQYEYTCRKIAEYGLERQVSVEIRDYRDMPMSDQYDKIVSIGMVEHVGQRNLPLYYETVHRLLRPDGIFLNQGIASAGDPRALSAASAFINRYVFPEGELETAGNLQRGLEQGGFEILDVESLRPHYALTLRHWVRRLEKARPQAVELVGETAYRTWRLYLAACALQFEAGELSVYQVLASRRQGGFRPLPLTRRDLYPRLRATRS